MSRSEQEFMNWYWNEASEQEKELMEKVESFGILFWDMLFKPGTCSYELTKVNTKDQGGNWFCAGMELPEELEDFDYSSFYYKVEELSDCDAYYNNAEKLICVSPELLSSDSTIMHEMIHLHEAVINDLPMYFHDMLYWALYKELKEKIPQLDEIITQHAHILTGSTLYSAGGLHDILFLLKSFDLDIRQGYPLGTVFSYGKDDEFKGYSYEANDNQTAQS